MFLQQRSSEQRLRGPGCDLLGPVTPQAPGLSSSDPADQGWAPEHAIRHRPHLSPSPSSVAKPDSRRFELSLTLTSPQLRALCGSPSSSMEKSKLSLWPMRPWPCCLLPTPGTTHPRTFALAAESCSSYQLNCFSSQLRSFLQPCPTSLKHLHEKGPGFLPCSPAI